MLKKEEKNVDCIDPLPPKRVPSGQVVVECLASSQCDMQNLLNSNLICEHSNIPNNIQTSSKMKLFFDCYYYYYF